MLYIAGPIYVYIGVRVLFRQHWKHLQWKVADVRESAIEKWLVDLIHKSGGPSYITVSLDNVVGIAQISQKYKRISQSVITFPTSLPE